jgi:heme/copper-type cytochrome/quinol oxidase subunit 2
MNMVTWRQTVRPVIVVAVIFFLTLVAHGGAPAAAEPKKFTLINVSLDDSKIWLPSSLIVRAGDEVEVTLINKLDAPHGFKIEALGIETVLQPMSKTTVRFKADKAGVYPFICQLHPPHIGGEILVLEK